MSTINKLTDLQSRRAEIEAGGGTDKVKKQHDSGKLTARERVNLLFDEGSFVEIDAFVTHRCSNFDMPNTKAPGEGVITGYGTVEGRLVYVYAQDFTVIGGSLGEMHAKKICKVMDMAMKMGAPIIGMNDSGGARIQEGLDALSGFGEIFIRNTKASGVIPQISVIMGPCAGGAVYSPAITDFVYMVENTSQMFITGPSVIKSVTGEDVSFQELGGAETHASKSGVAHFTCKDDKECIAEVRKLLSYLPSNNLADAPRLAPTDEINRLSARLTEIIPDSPNKSYDMKEVIREIVDNSDFYEVMPKFAQNIITCFARMNGQTVGIVANQPKFSAGQLGCGFGRQSSALRAFSGLLQHPDYHPDRRSRISARRRAGAYRHHPPRGEAAVCVFRSHRAKNQCYSSKSLWRRVYCDEQQAPGRGRCPFLANG